MGRRVALMPLSISNSLSRIAGWVVVEVVEYLVLLVDGVEETAEELDPFSLILEDKAPTVLYIYCMYTVDIVYVYVYV